MTERGPKITGQRDEVVLGKNPDGSETKLPPYVELEGGVQVHPERLEDYLERRKEVNEENK